MSGSKSPTPATIRPTLHQLTTAGAGGGAVPCIPHKWIAIETIGRIVTYRCAKCGATKTRPR